MGQEKALPYVVVVVMVVTVVVVGDRVKVSVIIHLSQEVVDNYHTYSRAAII